MEEVLLIRQGVAGCRVVDAADQLAKATKIMMESPDALQLRLLGTIADTTKDKPTTVVIPVPIELMKFFQK